jgi:hypothetical protein
VFARMSCHGHIVASLDNLGMELLVVRDVQLLFVVQESIEFFPLEKAVNQSMRAFLAENFEGLSHFDFAIGAVSNFLFECWGFGKGGSSKHDKTFRVEDQLVPVVFSVCDLEAQGVRERIGDIIFLARLVD